MRRPKSGLPAYFVGEPVKLSSLGLKFTPEDFAGDNPRVVSNDGGDKYVVGIFPTFVQNPTNGKDFNILAADTAQLYRATEGGHPKTDGLSAHAVKYVTAGTADWLILDVVEFFLSQFIKD